MKKLLPRNIRTKNYICFIRIRPHVTALLCHIRYKLYVEAQVLLVKFIFYHLLPKIIIFLNFTNNENFVPQSIFIIIIV